MPLLVVVNRFRLRNNLLAAVETVGRDAVAQVRFT
jgi:hypothetical protein